MSLPGNGIYSRSEFLRRSAQAAVSLPLMGGLLAGCGDDESSAGQSASGKTGTNLHSIDANNNDFWISFEQGSREACEALGMDFQLTVSDYEVAKQRAAFENAPTQGVKTVTMTATDEAGSASLIKILTDAGIIVVNFNSNAPWSTPLDVADNYIQYVSVSNYDGAYAMAVSLFEKMGGKGNLVHLQGVLGLSHDTERTFAVDAALKKYPGIKLVARQSGEYTRVKAQSVMEDIFTRESQIDGIFCQNDDMAVGVINSLRQHNRKALVAGVDGIAEWLDMIEDGADGMAYGTWAFHPRYGSALLAVTAFDALNGWKPSTPERFVGYGSVVIDSPEASRKYKEIVFADKSPWDYRKMSRTLNPDSWDPQLPVFPWDPDVFWARRTDQKPSGYQLPEAYAEARSSGEFEKVAQAYADRLKTDTLADVVKLSNFGEYVAASA